MFTPKGYRFESDTSFMRLFFKQDNLNRVFLKKKEFFFIFSKLVLKNKNIIRFLKKNKFNLGLRLTSKINNSCIITGRNRGVYRQFKSSRLILKGMSCLGYLPGIRKSS